MYCPAVAHNTAAMMLAYPTALIPRPTPPGTLPQQFHQLPGLPIPLGSAMLQAQLPHGFPQLLPAPQAVAAISPSTSSEKASSPVKTRSSFSIDSILGKKEDAKSETSSPAASTIQSPDLFSPRTPFSAGGRTGGLFYVYTQQPPPSPYAFQAASPTEGSLQQGSICSLAAGSLALIPELMRPTGEKKNTIFHNIFYFIFIYFIFIYFIFLFHIFPYLTLSLSPSLFLQVMVIMLTCSAQS